MAAAGNGGLVFYPAFCFKASPTHFTWVKLAAADVHRLRKRTQFEGTPKSKSLVSGLITKQSINPAGHGIFFHLNHPIRFVCLVGVVVARTEVPRRTILTVDDSSGATIDVVVPKNPSRDAPDPVSTTPRNPQPAAGPREEHQTATTSAPLDIHPLVPGTVVKVKGTLSTFRSTIQVQLERYFVVRDTNAEMRFLDQRVRVLVEVLSVPWVLMEEEVERLRVEADEEEVRVEGERRRVEKRRRRREEREERDFGRILRRWEFEERAREKEAGVVREEGRRLMREIERWGR